MREATSSSISVSLRTTPTIPLKSNVSQEYIILISIGRQVLFAMMLSLQKNGNPRLPLPEVRNIIEFYESIVLLCLSAMLADPNPDDPLLSQIANEYKQNYEAFLKKAREWTELYAKDP